MSTYKVNIPLIDDCLCGNISRNDFIKTCIPFWDMETYKDFLLYNYNGKHYAINNPNSYIVKNNCVNEAKIKVYNIDFENNSINNLCYEKDLIDLDMSYNDFLNLIYKNIDNIMLINEIQIPVYYFLLDNDDIFNAFVNSVNFKDYKINKDLTIRFSDYFVISRENGKFITLSNTANIFNMSIFTYKYFDIIGIFNLYFNNGEASLDIIEKSLYDLFLPYKDFVVANYNLHEFRKSFNGLKSRNLLESYLKSNVSKNEFKCIYEEKEDNNNIQHKVNSLTYEQIIKKMKYEIKVIGDYLNEFSSNLKFPEYKNMFLISILSFRIFRKKFLTGSWGFITKVYADQIKNALNLCKNFEEIDCKPYKKLLSLYKKPEIPPIYEFNMVEFMGVKYGNCMENTILQFIKLMFWNKKNGYNLNLVNTIVREPYKEDMKNFIQNITYEKEQKYLTNWVEFISYKIYNDNNEPKIEYEFVNKAQNEVTGGKIIPIELNATFNNFYNAMIKVFKIDGDNKLNKDKEEILNQFFEKNNLFIESITVEAKEKEDNIKIYTKLDNFDMILQHKTHAFFKQLSNEENYEMNLDIFKKNYKSISKADPKSFVNISQNILIKIIFLPDPENKNSQLFKYYMSSNKKLIKFIFNNFTRVDTNNIIGLMGIFDNIGKHKYIYETGVYWSALIFCYSDELGKYIEEIIQNDIDDDEEDDEEDNIDEALKIVNLIQNTFLDYSNDINTLKLWDEECWNYINTTQFTNETKIKFYDNILKYPEVIYNNCASFVNNHIDYEKFWIEFIKIPGIFGKLADPNTELNLYEIIVNYSKFTEEFWKKIAEYDSILNKADSDTWDLAIDKIKFKSFWNIVYNKKFNLTEKQIEQIKELL